MSSVAHDDTHHDEHHHEEHFVSKYIFSHDHKMIGKQFLMTAVFMGLVAMMLSIFFRVQLAWPGEESNFLNIFLGDAWAPNGIMKEDMYLGLVTLHGTIMVFFSINRWVIWNIFEFINSSSAWSARYGFGIYEHAFLLVLFSFILNNVCIAIRA
jgi:heme/copper-type cytochrome/quinol oxidase subunit 1